MILCEYDTAWATEFSDIRQIFLRHLELFIVEIHHVGSTAIPGMLAKPILDIDIEIPGYSAFPEVTEKLQRLGYLHEGDLGIPDRHAFRRISPQVPQIDPPRTWMEQHVYVCPSASRELRRQLYFRDQLRSDDLLRTKYQDLKQSCAARSDGDRKRYQALKERDGSTFFAGVLSGLKLSPGTEH